MAKLRTALLAATTLAALGTAANAGEISFAPVNAPDNDAGKRAVNATTSVTIDGTQHEIGWNTIARSGQKIGKAEFGVLTDAKMTPLLNKDGAPIVSDSADFTSLLPMGDKLYSVTHFEARPGALYLTELNQSSDGKLAAMSTKPIDLSSIDGIWVPCAGAVTPWNTHLGSEEYPPDARAIDNATSMNDIDPYVAPMARYNGVDPEVASVGAFKDAFKPYRYGFPVEVSISATGEPSVAKHYAMGRVAVELA
jgi:hypothetical protein